MDEDNQPIVEDSKHVSFECPNCGKIKQDDVVFLCNICDSKEVEEVDGVLMCPACKVSPTPLQCRMCDSKDVHMHGETVDLPEDAHPHAK